MMFTAKRSVILGLLALATVSAPVASFAKERAPQAREIQQSSGMDDAVRTLETFAKPEMQRDMGNMLSALVGSLMNLRVGEIANAAREMDLPGDAPKRVMRKMDPNTTLADLAGKGDPDFADNLDDDVRAMPKMVGSMAGSLAKMLPMLDAMARDMEAQLGDDFKRAKSRR
jgi:hypothetical protein